MILSKQQIKNIIGLHQKKIRRAEKLFIVEGEKTVVDLLTSGWEIQLLCATENISEDLRKIISENYPNELLSVSRGDMDKISPLSTPQGVLAVVRQKEHQLDINGLSNELVLVLDDIQDPGNLGTILRIADWFGIRHVICSNQTADCYNPKVVQASMGSLFRTSVYYMELDDLFRLNQNTINLPVVGTVMDGENIFTSDFANHAFLIFGNESTGLNENYLSYVTNKITVPSFNNTPGKGPDSLNVAMAAGIVCAEFRRRMMSPHA